MGKYEMCQLVMKEYFTLFPANTDRFDRWLQIKIDGNKKIRKKVEDVSKRRFLDFVLLAQEEYDKLVDEFGELNTKKKIYSLNDYIGSKGASYVSHYFTIRGWCRKENIKKPKIVEEKEVEVVNLMTEDQKVEIKKRMVDLRKSFTILRDAGS